MMAMMKKIAITGANGYLGKHSIKKFVLNGWIVNGIVRREEVVKEIQTLGANPFLVKNFEINSLTQAFHKCSAILHFANVVCGTKELFEKVNIGGLRNILEAASLEKVSKIIYPSGLGVDRYEKEEWATNNYFWFKKRAEALIQESGLNYTIFRPSYILGPNDELIPDLLESMYDGIAYIVEEGNNPLQPIFVENATDAFLSAAEGNGAENAIYDMVGKQVLTMIDLIGMIHQRTVMLGYNLPTPTIEHVFAEEAIQKLDLCKEMIEVMKCNVISDPEALIQNLDINILPIEIAIDAAIIKKLEPYIIYPKNSAIVLLSGGIDSTTALYWARKKGYHPVALSFNYLHRPKREIEYTQKITNRLKIQLIEVVVPFIKEAIELRFNGYPVPSVINSPQGYIPLRNLMFYSMAAYHAETLGINIIIGGHLKQDNYKFFDTSSEFFQNLTQLINYSIKRDEKNKVKILIPFKDLDKKEVVKIARDLNVPLEQTWSCYYEGNEPCGKCSSCIERIKALKKN